MAQSSAERLEVCLPYILKEEGGYTKNSKDPGNWTGGKVGKGVLKGTKYGIAASSFPTLDIANLTVDQAKDIYRQKYWTTAGCDAIVAGPDLPIFDVSVNSGPSRGKSFWSRAKGSTAIDLIKNISAQRRSFYQGLSTFKTFGKGWLARVARIEAGAIKLAAAAAGMSPVAQATVLKGEAAASTTKVKTGTTVATTTAAGGGGGVATAATQPGIDWVAIGLAAAAVGIALFIVLHFIRAHQERANAFTAEAAGV